MQFDEMGNRSGKTLMLLPGTACNYQANFLKVLDRLGEKGVRTKSWTEDATPCEKQCTLKNSTIKH